MGSSKGNALTGAPGSLGIGKEETTSKRKLQRQIAVARSQINMNEQMMPSNFDESKLQMGGGVTGSEIFQDQVERRVLQRQLNQQMPLGLTEQDL